MNIPIKLDFGQPSVSLKWPKDAVIEQILEKNTEGRWVAAVKLNGQSIQLPGTFPTELDAQISLDAYVDLQT